MNKFFYSGSFRKVAYKEGSGYIFKLGARRDYKNKTTGKNDYDNITFIASSFNEATINFVNNFVKDGDFVEIEGHFHSYQTEKDGNKQYHEDKICDVLRLIKRSTATDGKDGSEKIDDDIQSGFSVVDEECPW